MKILLPTLTLLVPFVVTFKASAEVMNVRVCTNISRTVNVLQQDLGQGVPRIILQMGKGAESHFEGCHLSENEDFLTLEKCQGKEPSSTAKFLFNKNSSGATLTTKAFFAKSYALNCREIDRML